MSDGFDRSIVESTAHRPWPMPSAPWLMTQSWNDLLFAHWRVDASQMRRAVPDVFDLDLFDGQAWLGVVPFYMTNVGVRAAPALPWISAFPELNVRTYVRVSERPGVYFFSLDAGRRLAVAAARALLNLPYYAAVMSVERRDAAVHYQSARRMGGQRHLRTCARPSPRPWVRSSTSSRSVTAGITTIVEAAPTVWRFTTGRGPCSRVTITLNTMAAASHLTITGSPPLLHFVRRQDVVAWAPTRLSDRYHRSVRNVTE